MPSVILCAKQTKAFLQGRRIIGSVSANSTSCSKVSSTDIDCVGLSGTTGLWSIPSDKLVQALTIAAEVLFEYGQVESS